MQLYLHACKLDEATLYISNAACASNMAIRRKQPIPPLVYSWLSRASSITNSRIAIPGYVTTDSGLAAVASHAAAQLSMGTHESFNTHMKMLIHLVNLRGGTSSVLREVPEIAHIIAHVDHSAAMSLVSTRRFYWDDEACESADDPFAVSPVSARLPPALRSWILHRKWIAMRDVYLHCLSVIRLLLTETVDRRGRAEVQHNSPYTSEVAEKTSRELEQSMYDFALINPSATVTGQFFVTRQILLISILVYLSILSHPDWQSRGEALNERLRNIRPSPGLPNTDSSWFVALRLAISLLSCHITVDTERQITSYLPEIYSHYVTLRYAEWEALRDRLLRFFLEDEICAGQMQTRWRRRLQTS